MDQLLTQLVAGGISQLFAWLASVGGLAAAVPLLLEAAKRWDKFPVLTMHSDTINRVVSVLAAVLASNGISYTFGGATKNMQESFAYALQALAMAIIFIYMILASQFKSFVQPLALMTSLPLTLIGVVLALLIAWVPRVRSLMRTPGKRGSQPSPEAAPRPAGPGLAVAQPSGHNVTAPES